MGSLKGNSFSWEKKDEMLKSYSLWAGYTVEGTPAVQGCWTGIPVGGCVVTLLWISLAQLNVQLSLLFPQALTKG